MKAHCIQLEGIHDQLGQGTEEEWFQPVSNSLLSDQ